MSFKLTCLGLPAALSTCYNSHRRNSHMDLNLKVRGTPSMARVALSGPGRPLFAGWQRCPDPVGRHWAPAGPGYWGQGGGEDSGRGGMMDGWSPPTDLAGKTHKLKEAGYATEIEPT